MPETAAQGEPEVIGYAARNKTYHGWETIAFQESTVLKYSKDVYPVPLITLQSHREALAKLEHGPLGKKFYEELSYSLQSERDDAINKADALSEALAQHRAALEECVGMLHWIDQNIDLSKYASSPPNNTLLDDTKAAITHANQVLEGGKA